MEPASRSELSGRYLEFIHRLAQRELCAAEPREHPLPPALQLECLWADGLLDARSGATCTHGTLEILDCGSWNRSDGPDFLRAEILINGTHLRGDIEISPSVTEWESSGHACDPRYNGVVLHVAFSPPPRGWYTRNACHREIPVLHVPRESLSEACGRCPSIEGAEQAPAPLEHLPLAHLVNLMQAAAARRVEHRRQRFRSRAAAVGTPQAWYEALAATLGYSANKQAMQLLARRAPLAELGTDAEAILFGTAGFLLPLLPERAHDDARAYHRHVWDAWWPLRDRYGLGESRRIPWNMSAGRPLNHPHRRVAALASAASHWAAIEPCLSIARARELTHILSSLEHPYWNWHCSLPSAPLARSSALIGKARIHGFLVNHVYVQDDSAGSWQAYLCLGAAELPQHVQRLARKLLGTRADVEPLLKLCFAQQALLQLESDCCVDGGYPAALGEWRG